jgi:DNA polymerase I
MNRKEDDFISRIQNSKKMTSKSRIFLFDAYALIYRSYFAFIKRPMINSKGFNTSAIYGFVNTLTEIMNREKPDYVAVVFDPPFPTFRHKLYHQYKANRLITPEEIKKSVPIIKKILEAFRILVIEIEEFEADDVIGTLAKKGEDEGYFTYMVTPDKDYMQLVSSNTQMYKPLQSGKYELIGMQEVKSYFGIDDPKNVVDILSLWGDASDNIPGAQGIGEKTAKELISKYHSLDNLFAHLSDLKSKQKDSIVMNKEQINLSHKLAQICTEVPLQYSIEQLAVQKWNRGKLMEIFQELEFKAFISRLLKEQNQEPLQGTLFESKQISQEVTNPYQSVHSVRHHYQIIHSGSYFNEFISLLAAQPAFCFDVETTSLNIREAELVGIAFSFQLHEAYYLPIPSGYENAMNVLRKLQPVFGNQHTIKVGQNLKYDLQVFMNYNVTVEGLLFDTMIAHYLLKPDLRHSLDYLAEIYLHYKMIPIEELIGKEGGQQKSMRDIDISSVKEYAGEDADITWQLYHILNPELYKINIRYLTEGIEMPLIKVLAEMEYEGFKVNSYILSEYSRVLKTELSELESAIFEMAGERFNINSPKQLGYILFQKMQISENAQKTKTKQYSTSEEVLIKLSEKHPIIKSILDYRTIQKLISTYIEALPKIVSKKTNKIHTSFDQALVSTGRLSSRNPNLQNIPVRDDRGKEIRKAFIPSNDQSVLLSADYSQIELRLMAHLSNDKNMISDFLKNADIHLSTAAKIFHVPENEVTQVMRNRAKIANFGIIYGISSFGLTQRLNITRSEASSLIQGYFESYPGVKDYMDKSIRLAREKGFVETIMGRRRYLPDINSKNAFVRGVAERNAINAPIQGSAADIIKLAMVNIQNKLRSVYLSKMILQIHDELVFNVPKNEIVRIQELVKNEMENVIKLKVPLMVDMGYGDNWFEAH